MCMHFIKHIFKILILKFCIHKVSRVWLVHLLGSCLPGFLPSAKADTLFQITHEIKHGFDKIRLLMN